MSQFQEDLIAARPAEILAWEVLNSLTKDYNFADVADLPQFYHYGDILAIGKDGSRFMIDVKRDTCIWKTKNVLCEERVHDKRDDTDKPGFMYSNYDYLCIVSEKESRLYIIDFKILKQIYKKGEHREFDHDTQWTDGYLLNTSVIKRYKGLTAIINYATGEVTKY